MDAHTPERMDNAAQDDADRPPSRRRVILNRVLVVAGMAILIAITEVRGPVIIIKPEILYHCASRYTFLNVPSFVDTWNNKDLARLLLETKPSDDLAIYYSAP